MSGKDVYRTCIDLTATGEGRLLLFSDTGAGASSELAGASTSGDDSKEPSATCLESRWLVRARFRKYLRGERRGCYT